MAGASRHCAIKVFDLRLPGGKVYYAADLDPCILNNKAPISSVTPFRAISPTCCQYHRDARWNRHNYNLFLDLNQEGRHGRWSFALRRRMEGPIYALSSPSPCSPTVFAGVERDILQLDVVSVMDRNPDPIYQDTRERKRNMNVAERWNPRSAVINMALYEHLQSNIALHRQQEVHRAIGLRKGWDERWPGSETQ